MSTAIRIAAQSRRVIRIFINILLLLAVLSGPLNGVSGRKVLAAARDSTPQTLTGDFAVDDKTGPLQDALAAVPSIQVSPDHAYGGQPVQVSGQGDPGYPGVRLAWMLGGATQTAAIVPVDGSGVYTSAIVVPADAPLGTVQVCAALSGTEQTAFSCIDFTVDSPPPGRVQGQITLSNPGSTVNAEYNLFDAEGLQVASSPVQADGSFDISNVPPGNYEGSVSGVLTDFTESGMVQVIPGGLTTINPSNLTIPCVFNPVAAVTSILVNPGAQTGLYSPSQGKIIGTYLSLGSGGQAVNVGITPIIQVNPGATLTKVEFYMVKPDGSQTLFATDTQGPIWQAAYNASLLPPGFNTIIVKPHVKDGCSVDKRVRLWVLPNPMADPVLRETQVSFDYGQKRYNFQGTVPNVGGALPIRFPEPPPSIPLIGTLENKIDAGLRFAGFLDMKGYVTMTMARTDVLVRALSVNIYNEFEHWINGQVPIGKYNQAKYVTPQFTLANVNEKTPIYSGPVVSFLGIVTLNASISIGFAGSIKMWVNIKPFEPSASMKIYPSVSPYLPVSLWLTFIGLGIASITGTTELTFGIPLAINTSLTPVVAFDDPCLRLRFWLEVWIGINTYYFGKATLYQDTYDVLDKAWGGCPALLAAVEQVRNQPRTMAQPVIASGPADRLLSVYIEDGTPTSDNTTPLVRARFWNDEAGIWGAPATLSDGLHYVTEPSAAFVGPDGKAVVVWIENTLTRTQGAALGTDLSAILSHQEIFYSVWDGAAWSSPQQFTIDSLADANPAIAGDLGGNATLAWVKDTDGDIATRSDLEIMTSDLTIVAVADERRIGERQSAALTWQAPRAMASMLKRVEKVTADSYMDVQPGVIRTDDPDMPVAITWTCDLDGEPATNGDRNVTVAMQGRTGWVEIPPSDPPPGSDSPAIGWDSDQNILYLAFLVRGKDGDGLTDTGLGDQAVLWTAEWTPADGWQEILGLADEYGSAVRGEAPRLQVQPDVGALLLFRRFDNPGTPGMYGGLAISRRTPWTQFGPPLYLYSTPEHRWMQSMALRSNGGAMLLSVKRTFPQMEIVAPGQTRTAAPDLDAQIISAGDDPVETSYLSFQADPALDFSLALSELHALSGTDVTVTAILRNVGRDLAIGMSVSLYSGTPGSGTLLDTVNLADPLEFNASLSVNFVVQSTGGSQPLYAEVSTSGDDASPANNQATGDLGALPRPEFLYVSEDQLHSEALLLSWIASPASGAFHYRLLRAESSGGPYELVGEAQSTLYSDLLLERGKFYYYVVQAEDAHGVRSPYSEESSAALPYVTYLPAVLR